MRSIGQNKWIIASKDLEEGDVVFEKAKYLGEEEGAMGPYHVFKDLNDKETYNIGGGHLHYLCQQISEGDIIKLTYVGEEVVESGKWKGKSTHKYEMLLYEDEDLGVDNEEKVEEKPASKSSGKSKRSAAKEEVSPKAATKTRGRPKKQAEPEPEEDEDDELDELEDI